MKLAGIILAAGKGKRFKLKDINKVVLPIGGRPMILYAVELLEKLNIKPIIIVVGFASDSVKNAVRDYSVFFVEQKEQLGPGNALICGASVLLSSAKNVLVINGDDAFLYEMQLIKKLIKRHLTNKAVCTFLAIEVNNPFGLGRVVRSKNGEVIKIVEEKDATNVEREICEVNPGCYVFDIKFLRKYLPKLKKSPVTSEYYLTDLVELAVKGKEKVETLQVGRIPWRGINTEEELKEAERLLLNLH